VSHLAQFELMNYQALSDTFDRVVSVGMFEHVGRGNHATYFAKVQGLLRDDGVSVLHTITNRHDHPLDAWVAQYVFPGGHLPTVSSIQRLLESHGLHAIDYQNLWLHYAETLQRWAAAHEASHEAIAEMFDERFYRMRQFWLEGSAAGFLSGDLGLGQFVFTKRKPGLGEWPMTRGFMKS
jgi:cyclopropane-fatty-acyl-phospholipid synthase